MKSLQVIDFLIFAKIIIVMVKKMLFLRLFFCHQKQVSQDNIGTTYAVAGGAALVVATMADIR